jgi:hypothetical protein
VKAVTAAATRSERIFMFVNNRFERGARDGSESISFVCIERFIVFTPSCAKTRQKGSPDLFFIL